MSLDSFYGGANAAKYSNPLFDKLISGGKQNMKHNNKSKLFKIVGGGNIKIPLTNVIENLQNGKSEITFTSTNKVVNELSNDLDIITNILGIQ